MGSAVSSPPRGDPRGTADLLLATALTRGNIIVTTRCEEGPPPPPPPQSRSQDAPPPPPTDDDSIASAAASAVITLSTIPNPGPYDHASLDCKRLVQLDTFDGFRCDLNKQVSPYMAAVHSFWLGTNMLPDGRHSSYSFLTQVADDAGLGMARVDLARRSVDGRIHKAILGGLAMAKLQVGVSGDGQQDQCLAELDVGGLTWTGNLKYGSMGGSLMYGCNYHQAITSRLSMGGEGMYIDSNQKLLSSYTIKYSMPAKTGDEDTLDSKLGTASRSSSELLSGGGGSSTICVNYSSGQQMCTMNYKRVVTPGRVTVGAELAFNPYNLKSEVLLGAEFKLQRSKYSVCVDPAAVRLQSVLEAKLGMAQGSPTLQFTADVAPLTDEMRFGYGITIDG
jgi:mitochondrial import receptor subunit TOM40